MHNDIIIDRFSDQAYKLALFGFTNSQIAETMEVTEKVLIQRAEVRINEGRKGETTKKLASILYKYYTDNYLKSE